MYKHLRIIKGMTILSTTINRTLDLRISISATNDNMRIVDPSQFILNRTWSIHITT